MTLYLGNKAVCPTKIVTKEVEKTKFGASVDTFFGDVDDNGVLSTPTKPTELNFAGVKEVGERSLGSKFYRCSNIISVNANTIERFGKESFYSAFQQAKGLKTATFDGVATIDKTGVFSYCFSETSNELIPTFKGLKIISGANAFSYAFYRRKIPPIEQVFPALEEISGKNVFSNLNSAPDDKTLYFISLKKITGDSSAAYNSTFNALFSGSIFKLPECVSLIGKFIFSNTTSEIHFAAKNQAEIEASEFYSSKWGATNATIYFDL